MAVEQGDPLPPRCFCGAPMKEAGPGKYPYPCEASAKYPQALVYSGCEAGHACWTWVRPRKEERCRRGR